MARAAGCRRAIATSATPMPLAGGGRENVFCSRRFQRLRVGQHARGSHPAGPPRARSNAMPVRCGGTIACAARPSICGRSTAPSCAASRPCARQAPRPACPRPHDRSRHSGGDRAVVAVRRPASRSRSASAPTSTAPSRSIAPCRSSTRCWRSKLRWAIWHEDRARKATGDEAAMIDWIAQQEPRDRSLLRAVGHDRRRRLRRRRASTISSRPSSSACAPFRTADTT